MTVNEHINSNKSCPVETQFSDMFPEYYVCRESGENVKNVYLRVDAETGPFYISYEGSGTVDEVAPYSLMRHDWEVVFREETPFEKLEE